MAGLTIVLIVAAAAGNAFLAYRKPAFFQYVFLAWSALAFLLFVGILAWDVHLLNVERALSRLRVASRHAEVHGAAGGVAVQFDWTWMAAAGAFLYLLLLLGLSEWRLRRQRSADESKSADR